jgi:type II secretory pathway pseudopilin PulG
MSRSFLAWLMGLLLVATATGYASWQQHREQTQLDQQLEQLSQLLMAANDNANHAAGNTLRKMSSTVASNRNQPQEMAVLRDAEALRARTTGLLNALQALRFKLFLSTGKPGSSAVLAYRDEKSTLARLFGPGSPAHDKLQQQLAAYEHLARQVYPSDSLRLPAPAFEEVPAVAALADLTQLERDVLALESRVLQHLAQRLATLDLRTQVVAVASAESNRVAPGDTFRAQLGLIKSLSGPSVSMTCNGQPIAIGPDGAGIVSFIVPTKPGPANWRGTIHAKVAGRDTTFQVRVPYRVARRYL